MLAAVSSASENGDGMDIIGVVDNEATERRRRWCFHICATERCLRHGLGEPSAVSVDDRDGSVVERVDELIKR